MPDGLVGFSLPVRLYRLFKLLDCFLGELAIVVCRVDDIRIAASYPLGERILLHCFFEF